MTTSTVRDTVQQHVNPSYLSYAGDAISALEQRDAQIADGIREAARQAGLSSHQVEQTLIQVGLVRAPEAVSASGEDNSGLVQKVEALERRLNDAARQARRHGISF
jgi:hypothetical protein